MTQEPIWRIVQDCARELTRQGIVPFTRKDLIGGVKRHNPNRDANSINPIIQGITDNLKGGAPGANGKRILHSVSRGQFVLYSKKAESSSRRTSSPHKPKSTQTKITASFTNAHAPKTENELRDYILEKLRRQLRQRSDIDLVPEGRLPYTLPGGNTLYHASDILAESDDRKKHVSIELKYKSAVTDQFKCRAYDALHMKKDHGDHLLCIMLFVKASSGISIQQAEKICYPFDRFIGIHISEIGKSKPWRDLASNISTFLY